MGCGSGIPSIPLFPPSERHLQDGLPVLVQLVEGRAHLLDAFDVRVGADDVLEILEQACSRARSAFQGVARHSKHRGHALAAPKRR